MLALTSTYGTEVEGMYEKIKIKTHMSLIPTYYHILSLVSHSMLISMLVGC